MRDLDVMELYQKLEDSKGGIETYFRKFENVTFFIQYKGDNMVAQVCIKTSDIEKVLNAPTIKIGDGEGKQTL